MTHENNTARSILILAAITAGILLIPLLAMQFTTEVNWTFSDFLIAGILISGSGLSYIYLRSKSDIPEYRLAFGVAVFSTLLLIWVNGAVGLIGSENNPFNMWYGAVVLTGIAGTMVSRFRADYMSYVMVAMSFVQSLIMSAALITGEQHAEVSSVAEIIGVNGFFIILFLVPAFLFMKAHRQDNLQE